MRDSIRRLLPAPLLAIGALALPGNTPAPCPGDFHVTQPTVIVAGEGLAGEVFNTFWSAFDQRYAVFAERLPAQDWHTLGVNAGTAIHQGMDDEDLYDILLDLARNLDDGHVNLIAPNLRRFEDAQRQPYVFDPVMEWLEVHIAFRYLQGGLTRGAEDEFSWGRLGRLGYLSITSLDDLSSSGSESADVLAARTAMQLALQDLAGVEGLIVDIRANGGGWDAAALEVATWFAGTRRPAWAKQHRTGPAHGDLSAPRPVLVGHSKPGAFNGPVVLLTSHSTFSAAETFALAMRVRDDVTLLGEPSSGHFSDLFTTCLPNGWFLTLSGERYLAADGNSYEGRGVPVDLFVPFDPAALSRGHDVMFEAAVAQLGGP